ncbi:MAG: DEAD/DEAH box helicase [Alphaproteobacteria bacterium]|nr:DEAD/DEAH box helicase [Alphaproteobacteria bacterium]
MGEPQIRVDSRFTPYQAAFLRRFAEIMAPGRSFLLLAPVGSGKSFAVAGTVAELLRLDRLRRVLVLGPAALTAQWAVLAGKWDQRLVTVDARCLRVLLQDVGDSSEWDPGWYAASIDFAKRPDVRDALCSQHWDLVVVDEAHRISGQRASLVEGLRRGPGEPGMLFLTSFSEGTPPADDLIDWSADAAAYLASRAPRAAVSRADLPWHRNEEEQALARRVIEYAKAVGEQAGMMLVHRASSSIAALEKTLARQAALDGASEAEPLLEQVEELGVDSKLSRLREWLGSSETPTSAPVVIYTEYRDTLDYLVANVADDGHSCMALHGGMDPLERSSVVDEFRRSGGILVTTAAEGVSLSFVGHAVHYDLPLQPVTYAQRIGRYDRFGRTAPCSVWILRDESGAVPFEEVLHRIVDKVEVIGANLDLDEGLLWRAVE